MKTRVVIAMVGVAGLAAAARASTTTLVWDASVNGGPFAGFVHASRGDTVTVRLRVSLTNNTGVGSVPAGGGLAGFDFLPTLTNSLFGDQPMLDAEQFATGSVNNPVPLTTVNHPFLGAVDVYTGTLPIPGRHGAGVVNGSGRLAPFGANGTNANGVPTPSLEAGTLVWRSGITSNAGVSVFQSPANTSNVLVPLLADNGTANDPSDDFVDMGPGGSFANNGRNNIAVFSYSFLADISNFEYRMLTAGCSVFSPLLWYTNASGATAEATNVSISPAIVEVNFLPSPGASAFLMLGAAFATRRRR